MAELTAVTVYATGDWLLVTDGARSLSMWYPRDMLQTRMALFWGGATLAGAFSGLLAFVISFVAGTAGLEGWAWIFVRRSCLTCPV